MQFVWNFTVYLDYVWIRLGVANDQKLPDSIVLLELNFYVQCFVDRLAIVLFVFRFTDSDSLWYLRSCPADINLLLLIYINTFGIVICWHGSTDCKKWIRTLLVIIMINATFNTNSAISWLPVLLIEEIGIRVE